MKRLSSSCLLIILLLAFTARGQTKSDSLSNLQAPTFFDSATFSKPVFSDTIIREDLIGTDSVSTLPPAQPVIIDTTSIISIVDSIKKTTLLDSSSVLIPTPTDTVVQVIIPKEDAINLLSPELTEVHLVVHVTDSTTKSPLKASVIMSTLNLKGKANGTGICNSNGYFNFKLTPNSHFEITVMYPEYIPKTLEVNFEETPPTTAIFKLDFPLNQFEVGDVIQLPNINFKQSDFHLQREAFPVLDKLVTLMKENPDLSIKLKGHTDNTGSPNANLRLSQQRINEVRYYLIRKGIKLNRLKGEGYGDTKPLVPNNSPENMQKNRRVEFEVLKI